MALDDFHMPTTSKFKCPKQIWTREVNISCLLFNSTWTQLLQSGTPYLIFQIPSSHSLYHLNWWQPFLPALQARSFPIISASFHSLTLQTQSIRKSCFSTLEIYPKMNHFSMASVLSPWPGPPLSLLLVTPIVLFTVLPTSTFVHAHPSLVSTLQPKKSWFF